MAATGAGRGELSRMAVQVEELTGSRRRDAARRYPPLVLFIFALVIALAVLPSALTLPRSNPAAVFEIVPSPPNNQQNTPNANFGALDLGSSGSLNGGGAIGGDNPGAGLPPKPPAPGAPPLPGAQGKTRFSKRCVRLPDGLHQTEDPLSPPCVADFQGDNGGATYQGVDGGE